MTKTPHKLSFADWVGLVRTLGDRQWEDGGIVGQLQISGDSEAVLWAGLFARAADGRDDIPCQILEGNPEDLAAGSVFRLNLQRPKLGLGYLFENTSEWLRNHDARCGRLERWYIADLDWMSGEANERLGEAYNAMLRLVGLMEKCAAVVDKSNAILVFLPGERLDIPIRYGESDLAKLNVAAVNEIVSLSEIQDGHTKQRREILATAMCDLAKDTLEEARFSYLVEHLSDLVQRFKDGYSLFASSFSFEKVRDQMEALRVDYTTRIHKALSDIQGQLLGIPISTIVVATQMKDAGVPGALMWGNIAVLLGAFIFVVLLFLAIRNQWHTLDVLGLELNRQEVVTRKEQADIAGRFLEVFSGLRGRIRHQRIILATIGLFCLGGLALAFVMFWAMTKPALSIFF